VEARLNGGLHGATAYAATATWSHPWQVAIWIALPPLREFRTELVHQPLDVFAERDFLLEQFRQALAGRFGDALDGRFAQS
jgi:hypothetical protein